jgi:hypothetical protein
MAEILMIMGQYLFGWLKMPRKKPELALKHQESRVSDSLGLRGVGPPGGSSLQVISLVVHVVHIFYP